MGMPAVMDTQDRELIPGPVLAAHCTWLAHRGRSPSSIHARQLALHRMAAAMGVPLLEATAADLAAWRAGLRVTGNTVIGYTAHARDFYGWAVRQGLRPDNPAADLPVPSYIRGLPRPIGETELMAALASAPPRVRPWLILAAWAGLRGIEQARLRRDRVLDTNSPPVLLVAKDATKGHAERIIPISGFVLAELRTYQRTRDRIGMPRAGYLFPRWDGGGGHTAPQIISHLSNAHLHACGIDATLHCLRHRFLSCIYQETLDLRLTQDLAGHASPRTTAGYAAFNQRGAAEAVNAIPAPSQLRIVGDGRAAR